MLVQLLVQLLLQRCFPPPLEASQQKLEATCLSDGEDDLTRDQKRFPFSGGGVAAGARVVSLNFVFHHTVCSYKCQRPVF